MVQSHKGVQRRPDSPSGGATGSIGDAAAGARATVRNVGFAEGEAALSPRVEGARPKGDRPALIGAKGKEGAGTILPGGAARGGAPQLGPKNADGLVTGVVATQDQPRVFMNGGKTGSDTIYWSGGTGGRGEQFVSSIDVTLPNTETASEGAQAKAWITPGTGSLSVKRSFKGVPDGDNGQYFITAAAAARVDVHEWLHVRSSERHHNAIIAPLEQRLAAVSGPANAKGGTDEAQARTALYAYLSWNEALQQWIQADHLDNTPMMAVDQAELAAADFPRHLGPATVAGKAYMDYLAMPGETLPAPPPAVGATPPAPGAATGGAGASTPGTGTGS